MNSVLQIVLGLILGGVTSYLIPLSFNFFLAKTTKQKILGTWISSWQIVNEQEDWVIEEIQIKKDFFRGIRFESKNNSKGYNWVGYGKILDKRYIIGEWYSLNSAAYASGVFIYTIAARGDYMTGHEAVPDENGKIYFREFYLGRKEGDLVNAKKWLKEHKE
ncbi:hypothetical protein SAMN04489761_4036 [Tenacibaculum sp. MAR_2009_124]|uniref:hypothetical protein n=1 Tax=Tenacibaculum sp. MAR_2009_124 TaxID=1250059 RepID=UPI0008952E9D|nr:hypothetical protein [Tenacibaculum sp. MAR_2009_124]SEC94191.1 hypothetical protein SAMN04489761_4036 [Tenacibaculum sp. MAR_2009_124]